MLTSDAHAELGRVLAIDDDEALADLIRVVLEDAGHEVVVATGRRDLPDAVFDCIVTDLLSLSAYSHDGARRWLLSVAGGYPNVPIIVVTAHGEARGQHVRLGVHGVVMKPFDVDELTEAVREAITS